MADFYQTPYIATLHNLRNTAVEEIEAQLVNFSNTRPLGLILPSLFSELETPAMPKIREELTKVPYLSQIVVGLDRADEDDYKSALQFFSKLPQQHRVLWHDGPRLRAIHSELATRGLAPHEPGKGRNVWYCMGYILATSRVDAVALHDCDILTYDRSLLARLIYPVAHPQFSFEFCKGYYARVADNKLNGRACRLLVGPLIHAMKRVKGENDFLNYLDSFRYLLAGEFAFRRDLLTDMRVPSDWGLEMGVASEMYRNNSTNRICQVELTDFYDHKHQDLSANDMQRGLARMSLDITKSLIRKLAIQGEVFSQETFRTLKATYYRLALDYVESFRRDAMMNGLDFDTHAEEQAVELFATNILEAGKQFLERPLDAPFMPTWSRVVSAMPDIYERLVRAVEEDHKEFSARGR
ncbi:MAG: glycosyl transferase [Proteobacteria bacterium]|nr:glycosyl transferase [Pseudomonadota bacterium]